MDWRRLAIFIGINIVVSATVTLIVLSIWESSRPTAGAPVPTPVVVAEATRPPATATRPASAPPAPTLTLTPTSIGPFDYMVELGDTLGGIALRFDVPLEELLAANGLTEDAILSVGQTITIPAGGSSADASAATPAPTSGPAMVVIREIESPGALDAETVILTNLGEVVKLTGWTLSDGGGKRYTFPDVTLFAGAEIKLHTRAGVNSPSNLYWDESGPVWGTPGTTAYLRSASGILVAEYQVP